MLKALRAGVDNFVALDVIIAVLKISRNFRPKKYIDKYIGGQYYKLLVNYIL